MALRHQIHDAVKRGSIDDVGRLLKENPELIDDKGEDEWTPMFRACYNGRLSMVKFLLEHGASLGPGADEWENSPLSACAINGHRDVAEYLLANGADVDCCDNIGGWTPLYAASYFGWPQMVELLLKAGADPTKADKEGRTPLDVACEAGYHAENRPIIIAMLQNQPTPTTPQGGKKDRPTPTRLSVSSLTTPVVPATYSNPPPYTDFAGSRVYFPWELHNSDYARRALDSLQELLLWLFKSASDAGVVPEPEHSPNPFKPCPDAYDLLLLALEQAQAIADYLVSKPPSLRQRAVSPSVSPTMSPHVGPLASSLGPPELSHTLQLRIRSVGAAAHRASYGKDDVEGLMKEVMGLAQLVGAVDIERDLQALLEQFTQHFGSKCARLRFLRLTHRLETSGDDEKALVDGGGHLTPADSFQELLNWRSPAARGANGETRGAR